MWVTEFCNCNDGIWVVGLHRFREQNPTVFKEIAGGQFCVKDLPGARLTQGEELDPVRGKAEKMGVKEIYIDDIREEFVRDFVFPMFRYPYLKWSSEDATGDITDQVQENLRRLLFDVHPDFFVIMPF